MMTTCRTIEPLLHLHREGELTAEEHKRVQAHVARCPSCSATLADLRALDAALGAERAQTVRSTASVADAFDERLARGAGVPSVRSRPSELLWGLLRPLRPAFGAVLAAAIMLLLVQVVEDGIQVAALERRLETRGGAVRTTTLFDELQPLRSLPPGSFTEPGGLSRASINPLDLLGPGLLSLFQKNNRLFVSLERKYPGLSTITTDDGLDNRERAILATEGKAFLGEIQQLLREGEFQR